jgi:MFS transporter
MSHVASIFMRLWLTADGESSSGGNRAKRGGGVGTHGQDHGGGNARRHVYVLNLYPTQPLLPYFRQLFHASELAVSLTVSATVFAVALVAPFVGVIAERMGRKRVIVPSLLLLTLPTALCGSARSLEALISWRFLQGASLEVKRDSADSTPPPAISRVRRHSPWNNSVLICSSKNSPARNTVTLHKNS